MNPVGLHLNDRCSSCRNSLLKLWLQICLPRLLTGMLGTQTGQFPLFDGICLNLGNLRDVDDAIDRCLAILLNLSTIEFSALHVLL